MDKVKQWVAVAVLTASALLAGGWTLLVAPAHGEAAALEEQAVTQEATNAQLATTLEVLQDKASRLADKRAELAEVAQRIPAEPGLPDLLRAVSAAAAEAGVRLTSITPTAPAQLAAGTAAAPAPAAAGASAEGAAPVAGAAPEQPAAPAVAGTDGLSVITLSMSVVGEYYAVEQFLALLEELPRALRVTGLVLDPGADALNGDVGATKASRSVTATVTGEVYLAPGTAAAEPQPAPAAAGEQPAAPAAAAPANDAQPEEESP